jgi:hypothetical protein
MGSMPVDEVAQGLQAPSRRPRPRWAWVAGAAVLVALGAWLVVRSGPMLPSGNPRAPAAVRSPSTVAVPLVAVGVPNTCPSSVDGRVLTLSFTLQNVSSVPLTVSEVTPTYPLGQMQSLGVSIVGTGRCEAPDPSVQSHRLEPGASLAVRFRLALPRECPAPYPVAARVLLQVGDQTVEKDTPVYPDLGGIAFPNCPAG